MDGYTQEYARVKQQELARENKDRCWSNELRGSRRRDGSIWLFWLTRR